jgi:hypothetical protein
MKWTTLLAIALLASACTATNDGPTTSAKATTTMAASTTTISSSTSTSSTTTTITPTSTTRLVVPRLTPGQSEQQTGHGDHPAATQIEIPEYVPQNTRRWQANQYGCHSDGRCLDDYDTWCDDSDMVELENASGGEVCYETYEWLADELAEEFADE